MRQNIAKTAGGGIESQPMAEGQRQALYVDFGVGQSALYYNRALVNEMRRE